MVKLVPPLPARLSLSVGERLLPALALHLDGHEAALVLSPAPRLDESVRLMLDWDDGGHTELSGCVREIAPDGRLTRLSLHSVDGDWRPFLAWLGSKTSA